MSAQERQAKAGVVDAAFEAMQRGLEGGVSLSETLGWESGRLEAVFELAAKRYRRRDYAAAETLFSWLARWEPLRVRTLKALAAARKMQGKYARAVDTYSMAALLDMKDPEPSFFAGECLFQLKDYARSRAALEVAREQACAQDRHAALVARIDAMLALLPDTSGATRS